MNIFNYSNKTVRAFTLIELMVVIAIIGLLSAVISTPILSARKKAKDAKKISDIKELANALNLYASDYSTFPKADDITSAGTLADLVSKGYLNALPSGFTTTTVADQYVYVTYNASGGTTPVGFHLAAKLETSPNSALDGDNDCSTIAACAPQYSTGAVLKSYAKTLSGGIGGVTGTTDFASVADTSATVCDGTITGVATSCIFDLSGQI